ncbi:fructosamine kinase family protein [Aliikangiella sp. IMCC44632]
MRLQSKLAEAIALQVSKAHNFDLEKARFSPVSGGDTSNSFKLSFRENHFFVKVFSESQQPLLAAEVHGISELAKQGCIKVPEVVLTGQCEANFYLILDFIPLLDASANGEAKWRSFAVQLAQLHNCSQAYFGLKVDNFIGSSAQLNTPNTNWQKFYVTQRLEVQLSYLNKRKYQILARKIEVVAQNIEAFFVHHNPLPGLVHGDLWNGNFGWTLSATNTQAQVEQLVPVIFDPACYYADPEVELAMMTLFSSIPKNFFLAYHQLRPRADGFEIRQVLYQLYHLLNHLNLFGDVYLSQVEAHTERLLGFVSKQ